jgi:deoxyribodipyrimidine photo-lyase
VQRKYHLNYPLQDSSKWPLSDHIMQTSVATFLEGRLEYYAEERDFPALKASSLLSPYLSTGVMSVRWLATQLLQKKPDIIYDDSVEGFSWLNELIWREFYKNLLYHCPELAKGRCFQAKYQTLSWPNNRRYYKAWCEGKTGYPLVDAAMKQLVQTGWMHNRLRMVVASFLTKHLLVDWRWGERFFMSHLIDGDLSANNGGWQWAASTGCDAQPYFRVFNPLTQSKKFDPSGEFIRTYLPELKDVPDKYVHFPHQYLASNRNLSLFEGDRAEYPKPIVEHKAARLAALAFFK